MTKKALYSAMATYAILMVLAVFTLDGTFRQVAIVALAAYAAKMWIHYLRES